jgi:thiamine pyrophosphokinase
VADGDVRHGPALDRVVIDCRDAGRAAEGWLIVAADGGWFNAVALGLQPTVVVGDLDSLSADGTRTMEPTWDFETVGYASDKDESDTHLAVLEAKARGATRIWIVGAIGGDRLEHAVANLLLLSLPALADIDARIVDGSSEMRVIGHAGPAEVQIDGAIGDYVSLLPVSDEVAGVTTRHLAYPLTDATLTQGPTRGLSNELAAPSASVTTKSGRLAVIHTVRTRN